MSHSHPLTIRLHTDGFAILPGVLNDARVARLVAAVGALNPRHRRRHLLRECPVVAELAQDLRALAAKFLSEGAFAARALFFDKLPGANWRLFSLMVVLGSVFGGSAGDGSGFGRLHESPPAY